MSGTLVVIIAYNAKRYTIECIESVREKLVPGTYKIVVVDNASTDGIKEWLSEQKDILLIKSETNIGFGPACNLAIHSTVGTEYEKYDVFLLNSDTHLTSTALPRMQQALYGKDDIGAVGATANYAGNRQQIDVSFDSVSEYINYGEKLAIPEADAHMEKVRLNGFAMLIRRKLWDEIGGFDEDFAPGYYEDDALSMEILKRGFRLIWVRNAFIYHAGSASFVKTGKNTLSIEHHKLFMEKYGFDILNFAYPCGAVISQIPFYRSDSFKLLYLGCGLGAELKAIRSFFPNAATYGIEKDPVLYSIVSKTEKVFISISELKEEFSIESPSADFNSNGGTHKLFDLLIVDSVFLEGLSDEEKSEIAELCKDSAVEINRLHYYDDYPFDNVKLILWDKNDYNEKTATLLSRWGIMSSVYSCDNLKKRIKSYGIGPENMLLISSENIFRANSFILCPNLPSADSSIVPYLTAHYSRLPANDPSCQNAQKLYMFEHKMALMEKASFKEAFLIDSQIQITINRDCFTKIKGIYALLQECYLMDYVKADYDLPHLERLVTNSWNDCGYITCKDKDQDYGLVGFYCINKRENKVLSFSFSWTVTGLGIENYVYNKLGAPAITPKDSRSPELFSGFATPWIREDKQSAILIDKKKSSRINILLKGNPSIHPIEDYLIGGNVTTEYDDQSACTLPTKLSSEPFHIIIYSLLQYDFDAWEKNSEAMLAKLFGKLEQLSGSTTGNPTIILLLGCEKSYEELSEKDKRLSALYKELNPIISSFASDQMNFRTINISDLVQNSSDFKGSINDFSVRVYSDIVERIVIYINEKIDELLNKSP